MRRQTGSLAPDLGGTCMVGLNWEADLSELPSEVPLSSSNRISNGQGSKGRIWVLLWAIVSITRISSDENAAYGRRCGGCRRRRFSAPSYALGHKSSAMLGMQI